jgi:tetratricopeptide (TPR) repeat protein
MFAGDSDAIAMAQDSIDRCVDDDAADAVTETDLDQLASVLELLGNLGVGPMADESLMDDRPVSLGRFEIMGERGRGGFGLVLRAFDPLLQREVALKVPRPQRLMAGQSPDDFIREAQVAAGLEHDGIVRVYEVRRLGPVWYIASAYCDGPTLGAWLDEREAPLSPSVAASLMTKIADAVHFAHSRGVLHLDLKPDNILLDGTADCDVPRPMVTDFGLASRRDAAASGASSRIAGTLAYMAPEQLAGESAHIGVAADVYALGAVLHEMIVGRSARHSAARSKETTAAMSGEALVRAFDAGALPGDLSAICQKCLRDDPAERYDSARELADDLHRYLRGQCVLANPVAWPGRLLRTYRRRPAVAALVTLLAATITGSVVAMAALWRQAESNLARLKKERELRSQAAQRMEHSLLNLTWLAQERSMLYRRNEDQYAAALPLLREFLHDVCTWRSGPAGGADGLSAAAHSLAIVQGMDSIDDNSFEQDFRYGLDAWLAVIKREPDCPQWRRALAMHLLTHAIRERHGDWLWWKSHEARLDAKAVKLAEEPYASLLIDYAQAYDGANDTTFGMLHAAVELLEDGRDTPDVHESRRPLLLIAYNRLANAAMLMSEPDVAAECAEKANVLVNLAPPAASCDPTLAAAVGDALQSSARRFNREQRVTDSLPLLERAAEYYARAVAAAPQEVKLRLADIAVHRFMASLQLAGGEPRLARDNLATAIAVANVGLKAGGGPRALIGNRAGLYVRIAAVWRELGETSPMQAALEGAVRDFAAMNLRKQDSRSLWLNSIDSLQSLGGLYADSDRVDDSIEAYEQSLALLAELKPRMRRHPLHAKYVRIAEVAISRLRPDPIAADGPN